MRTVIARCTVLFFATLGVAACGSSGSTPTSDDTTDALSLASISRAELSLEGAFFDDALDPTAMKTMAPSETRWIVARPIYRLLQAWIGEIPIGCINESGWIDRDGDGLPLDSTYSFSCHGAGGPNGMYEVTGTIEVKDQDDADAKAGFEVDFNTFHARFWLPDNSIGWDRTTSGTMGLVVDATKATRTYELKRNLVIDSIDTNARTGTTRSGFATTSTLLYVPDPSANPPIDDPVAFGTITAAGGATLTVITANGPVARAWTRQTIPTLHWNRGCGHPNPTMSAPPFDGGGIGYRDDLGNALRVVFTGCGNWATFWNGATTM